MQGISCGHMITGSVYGLPTDSRSTDFGFSVVVFCRLTQGWTQIWCRREGGTGSRSHEPSGESGEGGEYERGV